MPALKAPLRAPTWGSGEIQNGVPSGARTDTKSSVDVWTWSILGVILVVGAGLRLVNLGHSFWGDEDVTVQLLRQPLWFMIRHGIPGSESTPPLYYLIAWVWSHAFGATELGVRSLSALIGVATVAVAYPLGLELRGRRSGLILAAFVAVSPFAVWFSQDARAYGLAILFITAGLLYFARGLRTASSRTLWLWAAASALALASHYFTIFVVVPEAVALLAFRQSRRPAVWPTAALAATWLALLPLLLFQRVQAGHLSWIKFLGLGERLKMTLQFFETGSWNLSFALLGVVTLAVAVVIGLAFASRRIGRREWVILAVGASAIVLPSLAAVAGFDYVNYQNLVMAWMPFAAVLAAAMAGWRRVGIGLAAAVLGLSLAATLKIDSSTALQRPNWRLATTTLAAQRSGGLFVIYPAFDIGALSWYDHQLSVVNAGDAVLRPDDNFRIVQTRRIQILAEDPWVYSAARTLRFRVPPGFHETKQTAFSTFVLDTYTAPRPERVVIKPLASTRPSGDLLATTPWTSAVFFERHSRTPTNGWLSGPGGGE
jgi:4-amino-4-deoxy-L-arabinose transferase-like glycosyltransferase